MRMIIAGWVGSSRGIRSKIWVIFLVIWGLAPIVGWAQVPTGASEDPVAREVKTIRGIADFEHGRYDQALEHLESDDAGSSYYRGQSLLALRRAREALAEFERVRKRSDAPSEVVLDLGIAQLSAGETAKAETTLAEYAAGKPDDSYGRYFLGVAQFRLGRFDQALRNFEAASRHAALAPYLDFYRGLADYQRGDVGFRASLDRYRATGRGQTSDLATRLTNSGIRPGSRAGQTGLNASTFGRPIDPQGPAADRRWNLAVLSGYEYDSNVSLAPTIITGGLGVGLNRPDSRWVVSSFGEYRPIQREELIVGVIGSTYDSFQFNLPQFNFQDYMGGAYTNALIRENLVLGGRYEFHESLLAGQQFSTEHRLTPNLTFLENTFGHTTAYYEFDSLNISGFALVPAQIRSGSVNAMGLTQAVYLFGGAGRFYAGYRYENAATRGQDFNRDTNMITARLEVPLPWRIVAHAEARQFWDDYRDSNSLDFFGRQRSDRRVEVRTGFQKFLTPHLSVRAEYIYTNSDSNLENLFGSSLYSYNRHLLSTLLIYDF